MTKFNLILELTTIINDLLETGVTACNVHEARKQMDCCFDQFEEHETTVITGMGAILDKVAANIANLPKELTEYFQTIEEISEAQEDDFHESLSHFFPNLADDIAELTIFPVIESECDFNADI